MKIPGMQLSVVALLTLALTACGSAPRKDLGQEKILSKLDSLRAEQQVSRYASAELQSAEEAVRAMQQSTASNDELRAHLAYLAERRIDIARARASEGHERQRLVDLQRERDQILLRASLQEAEKARAESEQLRRQNMQRTEEAEQARQEADEARQRSLAAEQGREQAEQEARQAQRLADARSREADLARQDAQLATATADSLRRQLENLQARETNRGLMFTLGDVLFETNQAELRQESLDSLERLVTFINDYPDRLVSIEGHTDSVGSEEFNLHLSQQRADGVRSALIERGVSAQRVQAVGLGEEFPLSSNENEPGRRQNRRVEIIILKQEEG